VIAERSMKLFAETFAHNTKVDVSLDSVRGRRLVARSAVDVGATLIDRESPAVFAPLDDACHACLSPLATESSKRCGACRRAFYCSPACQRSAWSEHKVDCRAISQLPADAVEHVLPHVVLTVRIAWLFIRERKSPRVERISTLLSNAAFLVEAQTAVLNAEATLASRILFLQAAPDSQYVSVPFLTSILATITTNAIGVTEATEYTDVGVGLYERLALLNHSCDPSAVILFDKQFAVLRAIRPIAAGEELTISYCDRATDRFVRQKLLLERYRFTCACTRCAGPLHADVFDVSLRCCAAGDGLCDGQVVRQSPDAAVGTCSKCGAERAFEAPQAAASQALAVVRAFDDRLRTKQFESLLRSVHPRSLAVRRFLQDAERDALHAALGGALAYGTVFRWSNALLEFEKQRLGNCLDVALSKQFFAAGRLALEGGEFAAAVPLLREALERMSVTCTSQQMLASVRTFVLEAEQRGLH
jgi:hypothetical protein